MFENNRWVSIRIDICILITLAKLRSEVSGSSTNLTTLMKKCFVKVPHRFLFFFFLPIKTCFFFYFYIQQRCNYMGCVELCWVRLE